MYVCTNHSGSVLVNNSSGQGLSSSTTRRIITQGVVAWALPAFADSVYTGAISGVMTNAVGPMAFARVALLRDGNIADSRVIATFTDASGNYAFHNVAPGNYIVVPFDPTGAYRSKVIHTVVP